MEECCGMKHILVSHLQTVLLIEECMRKCYHEGMLSNLEQGLMLRELRNDMEKLTDEQIDMTRYGKAFKGNQSKDMSYIFDLLNDCEKYEIFLFANYLHCSIFEHDEKTDGD